MTEKTLWIVLGGLILIGLAAPHWTGATSRLAPNREKMLKQKSAVSPGKNPINKTVGQLRRDRRKRISGGLIFTAILIRRARAL